VLPKHRLLLPRGDSAWTVVQVERRTRVVRSIPNAVSCSPLALVLAVEMQENWLEATRDIKMARLGVVERLDLRGRRCL
jgi:transposase-like protein